MLVNPGEDDVTLIEAERPARNAEAPLEASLSLRLWLQLLRSAKTLEAEMGSRFRREFDQSLARFDVLSQLYRLPERRGTVGQIAASVMAASGNITALIDRMEHEGLVERRASPTDRRSSEVTMTAAGLKLFRQMLKAHNRWMDEALGPLPDADKEQLIGLLRRVRQVMAEDADSAEAGKT